MLTTEQRLSREAAIGALRAIHGSKDRAPQSTQAYWQHLEDELSADAGKRQSREDRRRQKRLAEPGRSWDTEG